MSELGQIVERYTLMRLLYSAGVALCFVICALYSTGLFAQEMQEPFAADSVDFAVWGPKLTGDSLMPTPSNVDKIRQWSEAVFAGRVQDASSFALTLVRQDHNTLKYNESCMGTPLRIGSKNFDAGLGTHANSEILVEFPEPVTRFTASVGVDNNYDTQGTRGSIVFIVKAGDRELLRTPVRTGRDEPFPVDISLPAGTNALRLIVETTKDGPSYDHADWATPIVHGESGRLFNLASKSVLPIKSGYPFSFKYGGVASAELLPKWAFAEKRLGDFETVYSWTDPKTGFKVSAVVKLFGRFNAVDWVLLFENTSQHDSLLLEDVRSINLTFPIGVGAAPVVVNTLTGDSCDENSWLPVQYPLRNGEERRFAPVGGRPSSCAFPFWNAQRQKVADDQLSEGLFVALGWTGQWQSRFHRANETDLSITGGIETLSTILLPGESITTPRVLLMPWKTDRLSAHALFRRLLLFEYAPKRADGMPQNLLFVGQCFDRYYRQRPKWETFDSQAKFAKKLAEIGCNAYWFDAAWFPVGFPEGAGNWYSDPVNFPNGVEEIGKVVHDLGLKFVLWFEPERVAKNTQIANEHPEFVFDGEPSGLYKLNDPAARKFLGDLLLKRIKEFGVDVFRNDFNIDPLGYWHKNDTENRRGITEIRYVEGHYDMWNRLRRERPGLWIDNCASGGRRIDLSTTSISIPLWRSDTGCWAGGAEWDQNQTLGLAQYLPIFSCCVWDSSPYTFRSGANMGAIVQYNFLDDDYDIRRARDSINEAKVYQKFWYGDFYPLSTAVVGKSSLLAWQWHRPDLNAGLVYVFRQPECDYTGRELRLRGIEPTAAYRVVIKDDYSPQEAVVMTGDELRQLTITAPKCGSAIVVEYEKNGGN